MESSPESGDLFQAMLKDPRLTDKMLELEKGYTKIKLPLPPPEMSDDIETAIGHEALYGKVTSERLPIQPFKPGDFRSTRSNAFRAFFHYGMNVCISSEIHIVY